MIRFEYILAVFTLIAISACQSDGVEGTAKKATKIATPVGVKEVKPQIKQVADTAQLMDKSPTQEKNQDEEDKSKKDLEKATSKPSNVKEAKKSTDKPVAKPKPRPRKSPKLSFADNTYAFGVIKPGEIIEHKFEFTNTGNADLVIKDAKASCGCTQPSFPFVPIPPGEKGFIGVKYDSTGKLGSQKPTVTLTTNASPKTQKVYLEGLVISELAKQ